MRLPKKRPMRSQQTEPMRSPQKRPMRSPKTDPMRSPKTDPMRSPQALHERLRAFRTQAVRENYKVSMRPPATLLLSPRVSNYPFSLPALNAQLTSSGILVTIFRVCGNGDYGVCYVSQHEEISTCAPRFRVEYQGSPLLRLPESNLPRSCPASS